MRMTTEINQPLPLINIPFSEELKSVYQDYLMIINNDNIKDDEYKESIHKLEYVINKIKKELSEFL